MKLPNCVFVMLLVALGFGALPVGAQNTDTVETRPTRGVLPTADQITTPVDSIDPVSGKLHLSVPLASLPRGRANSGFDLNLEYDSHLYDLEPEVITYVPAEYLYLPQQTGYRLSSQWNTGGWHYNIDNLRLDVEEMTGAVNDGPCPANAPRLVYRVRVGMLDGSLHTMILKGWEPGILGPLQDGFAGLHPLTGRANHCATEVGYPNQYTGWLSYYSIDGSYLKLETYVDGGNPSNTPFYVYFPDGRRMSGHGSSVDTIYDANANAVHLSGGCYDSVCNQIYRSIKDDIGHEIRINYNVDGLANGGLTGERTDSVVAQGPLGPITTTINWEVLQIGADNRAYTWSTAPWSLWRTLLNGMLVVKYIQLPLAAPVAASQTPPVFNSYAFGYSDDADLGYGEVDMMRTPTGSQFQYRYVWEGFGSGLGFRDIAFGNSIRERKIIHDGIADLVWTYSYSSDKTTINNPDGGQLRYWHRPSGNYLDSSVAYNFGVGDVVYRIDQPDGSVKKRLWSQNRTGLPFDSNFPGIQNPWIRRETTTVGNAAGAPALSSVIDRMIDKNGNLLRSTEYDWVTNNPYTPEAGAVAKRVTQFTYYSDVPDATSNVSNSFVYWAPHFFPLTAGTARRLDAVRRKELLNGAGSIEAVVEFAYDDPFRSGNPTSELRWDSVKSASAPALGQLNGSNAQVLTRTYDAYGNITDFYEPEVRTHITYDGSGSKPARVDYAYGTAQQRSVGYSWDGSSGALNSKADLDNNITTTFTYDAIGRQLTLNEAGMRKTQTFYDDANLRVTVKRDLNAFGDGKLQTTTQYDQLGRSVLTRAVEPGNADGIKVKSAYYPALNRTVRSSPYRTTSDATLEWTCTQTDSTNRVIAVAIFKGSEPTDCASPINRTGVTSTFYDANQTTVTDPASKQTRQIVDGTGRLVQVIEDPAGLSYSTSYGYNALGNLTQVQQGEQTRTFNYSSLGRLISASNPETGTFNYSYLDSGELASRSDARGMVSYFTYDAMHRVRTKSYSGDGGITPDVTYSYYQAGAAAPNFGQLQSVASSSAVISFGAYDGLGLPGQNTQVIDGALYTLQYAYRLNGVLRSMQYPTGKIVDFDVDDAGRVEKVSEGSNKVYVDLTLSEAPFTPDGRIAQMKLGNDLWETHIYQTPGAPTLLRLGSSAGSGDKLELEYDFSDSANNGNLLAQVIRQPGRSWTQTYSYDSLNRIVSASEVNGFSRAYGYDRYGNRWISASSGITAADFHEPMAGSLFNPANNQLPNQTYDGAGNLTSYAPRTLIYDAENRLISASSSLNGNESFVYDGNGRRVRKFWTPNGGATQVTDYVYGTEGQVVAEYMDWAVTATGTSWMFRDLLGSVRAVTGDKSPSSSGTVIECYDYLPFGRMLSASDNGRDTGCYPATPDFSLPSVESPKFTGQTRDVETELDYFGARYYSGAQGRFLSPDAEEPDLQNPQTLNKYRYALNNPLRYVDPDGRYEFDVHMELTRVLALAAGIRSDYADRIAKANQGTDDNSQTSPFHSQSARELYHFTDKARRDEMWAEFQADSTPESLGQFLHAEQDSFAHEGYGPRLGHLFSGIDPTAIDKTYNDPEKADKMAADSLAKLIEAARLLPRSKRAPLTQQMIDPYLKKFNRARSLKEKRKILGDLEKYISKYYSEIG